MNKKLTPVFIVVLLDLIGFGIIIPLLPIYALKLGASKFDIGLMMSSYSLAQFIFSPFWGSLSDRMGRKKILIVTIFGSVLTHFATALAGSFVMLLIVRFLAGAMAGNISVASALVADLSPPEKRTSSMALIGISFGLGFILGPAIGAALSINDNVQIPYLVAALLSLINGFLAIKLLPSPAPVQSAKRKFSHIIETFSGSLPFSLKAAHVIFFLIVAAIASMETTTPVFLRETFELTAREFGLLMAGFGIVMVLVQGGIVRRVSHRFSDQTLFSFGLSFMVISFLVIGQALSSTGVIVGFCLLGFGYGFASPSLQSFVSKRADNNQGYVMGTYQAMGSLARALVPLLAGYIYEIQGYGGPSKLNFFACFLALILAQILWMKEARAKL